MVIKTIFAIAVAVGIIGFLLKAKSLNKEGYHSSREWIALYVFFACTIISVGYFLFFV